jgi:hypothetical protein
VAQLAPKSLSLSECERLELEKLLNRHSTPQQIALRAKIILLAEEGKNNREIGRELNISRVMARRWRDRWLELGTSKKYRLPPQPPRTEHQKFSTPSLQALARCLCSVACVPILLG